MPVTTLTSNPSARCTRPITSICHSSIARPRSQRRWSARRRLRLPATISPWRINARYTEERPGNGSMPARSSSQRIRVSPYPGCSRRSATIRASTTGGI
jgi:hypothetical protein